MKCSRRACQVPGARQLHRDSKLPYCIACARRINAICGERVVAMPPTPSDFPAPWHPHGVRWDGFAWVPYDMPAWPMWKPGARPPRNISCTLVRDDPSRLWSDCVKTITETCGPGWRGFLRAVRPYLQSGFRILGGIHYTDTINRDRDSAGN